MIRRLWDRLVAPLDPSLMTFAVLLALVSLALVASASPERLELQLRNLGVAFLLMRVLAQVPPQRLLRLAVPIYVTGVALLIGVALFGEISKGARRWLNLGVTRIQPSEMMKIAVPLLLAWFFQQRESLLRSTDWIVAVVLLLLPVGLIVRQPDLGTAVLVLASGCYVIFFAGLSWKIIVGLVASGIAALPLAWSLMHDYQRDRVLTLIDPEKDPLGKGFHIIQSTIAIGSGGLLGKGWFNGTQTQLDFLPERHTDFIFAVLSEEFGLIGNVLLLVLYLLLIGRGLMIAANGATLFARLLGGAITLIFFTYAFVNMGMVTGILPVVGVPLPFISYGGTALMTLFVGIGMLMSIQSNRQLVQK